MTMIPKAFFTPDLAHEFSTPVDGVDADLLADLYDCVAKYGRPIFQGKMRQLSVTSPKPVFADVVLIEGRLNIRVLRRDRTQPKDGRLKAFLLSDPMGSYVAWEDGITPDEVRALIAYHDAAMARNGDRVRADHPIPERDLISVAAVFTKPGAIILVQQGHTLEELLARFDRPEELYPIRLTMRGTDGEDHTFEAVCHIRDKKVAPAAVAAQLVQKAWGITHEDVVAFTDRQRFDYDHAVKECILSQGTSLDKPKASA